MVAAFAHQDVPFEKLVETLQPPRDPSRNPLFQVLLVLQNTPHEPIRSRLNPEFTETDTGTAKFDLSLYLDLANDTLRGRWEFNTDLFDRSTIERMNAHWQNLLDGMVADPDRRISELPLLSDAETHQLLVEWNNTAADFPIDDCLHHLFEEQAARHARRGRRDRRRRSVELPDFQ